MNAQAIQAADPLDILERERGPAHSACQTLSDRERGILSLLYEYGYTLKATGAVYGVSVGRVSEIRDNALAKLRKIIERDHAA